MNRYKRSTGLVVFFVTVAGCSAGEPETVASETQALCSTVTCTPLVSRPCGEGNYPGIQQCNASGTSWGACLQLDHLVLCKPGAQRACSVGNVDGWQTCKNTQLWGTCSCDIRSFP